MNLRLIRLIFLPTTPIWIWRQPSEVILLDLEDGIIVRLFFIGAPRQSGHPLRGTALDEICRDDFNYFGFQPCVTLMPFSRIFVRHTIL